jgi:hypothetical protein
MAAKIRSELLSFAAGWRASGFSAYPAKVDASFERRAF